jgi:hypothetical protein
LVFNAIPDLGTPRPDFLDRALVVEASPLYEPLAELPAKALRDLSQKFARFSFRSE